MVNSGLAFVTPNRNAHLANIGNISLYRHFAYRQHMRETYARNRILHFAGTLIHRRRYAATARRPAAAASFVRCGQTRKAAAAALWRRPRTADSAPALAAPARRRAARASRAVAAASSRARGRETAPRKRSPRAGQLLEALRCVRSRGRRAGSTAVERGALPDCGKRDRRGSAWLLAALAGRRPADVRPERNAEASAGPSRIRATSIPDPPTPQCRARISDAYQSSQSRAHDATLVEYRSSLG